ncbi:MAG: adenylate/guanylate cyclase domain-containing protein [Lautropia sp.]|nr:adenylate/guanylate cyclase domain-containing protein [Lautropia sp.]
MTRLLQSVHALLRSFRLWATLGGLCTVVLACAALLGYLTIPVVQTFDRLHQDHRLRWMPVVPESSVLIVDIDEKSLQEQGRWTWPRKTLARLVDHIVDDGGARVLGFDIVFAELSPGDDQELVEAIRDKPVVLGYYFTRQAGARQIGALPRPIFQADLFEDRVLPDWDGFGTNIEQIGKVAQGSGFFNARIDDDGVVRSVPVLTPFDGQMYESLALAILRAYEGNPPISLREQDLSLSERTRLILDESLGVRVPFAGAAGPGAGRFEYIPATDVLEGRVDPQRFRDRIVLVGASAPGIGDRHATPVNRSTPGVEVHATLIASALAGGMPVVPWHAGYTIAVLTIILGGMAALWMPRLGAPGILLLMSVLLAILYGSNAWMFGGLGWIMPLAAPMLALVLIAVLNLAVGHFIEGKARRAVIQLFGQYVSPKLVQRMARQPEAYPIESQNKRLTILFADIRGFTRMAESMDPQVLREYLNMFLTRMTEVIHQHQGTVDKYMGDAIMAFWGAPVEDAEQEDHAVVAAIAMQDAVAELNQVFAQRGWPALMIGIGINSGTARVGDMGSQLRRTYTAIGDAVNLAARLEALTKRFGLPVLLGETTARQVQLVELEPLGEADVPGRSERVRVFCPKRYVKPTAQEGAAVL